MKAAIAKRLIGVFLLSPSLSLSGAALAGEVPFTQARFDQAMAAGTPTVVYLHATWCPTCKVQQPIVDRLSSDPQFKAVTILEADYDKEVALKKDLKVTQQSTFVVFQHGHEVTRSTGQTQEAAIRATFARAL